MKTCDLSSWQEFPAAAEAVARELQEGGRKTQLWISPLLFRGHGDAAWDLATTLERFNGTGMAIADYYQAAYACRHEIEAHTGRSWAIPSPVEYRNLART